MSIYEELKNPLTMENIEKILAYYADNKTMYNALTRTNSKDKVKGRYIRQQLDALYLRIFQDWKRAIMYQARVSHQDKEYERKYKIVAAYLKDKNPKTNEEVLNITYTDNMPDGPLKTALDQLRWNSIGEYSGWDHIHSAFINYGLQRKQVIHHRLYINCDSTVEHKLMRRFIEKCNERKLPYYFKFDEYAARDDTIVIYSSTEHLPAYIEILKEIKKEEGYSKELHKPPVLTSPIAGWIGYGSEPKEQKESFNSKRSDQIEECVKKEAYTWMVRNLNSKFKYNGKETTYKDHLIKSITKALLEHMAKYAREDDNFKKYSGYRLSDCSKESFKKALFNTIIRNFDTIMDSYRTGKLDQPIIMTYNGSTIKINKYSLDKPFQQQVGFMSKYSKRFKEDLLKRIKETSSNMGIDPNNYACDIYLLDVLKGRKQQVLKQQTPKQKPTPMKTKEGYIYRPMTDEEIKAAQKKLGIK